MPTVKEPAVAGLFYPQETDVLRHTVDEFLQHGISVGCLPKCIVAPHAGYQYSGAVAGSAYAVLKSLGQGIKRVVILGPAHRVAVPTCALPSQDFFATPLGQVPVDRAMIEELLQTQAVTVNDAAFAQEHSLEVQLPFLQRALGDFTVVPILVGGANLVSIAHLLAQVWRGPETLIVVSTDLSHYLSYAEALQTDLTTVEAVSTLRLDHLKPAQACGFHPLLGLMHFARTIGLTVRAIDYKNSGDTAGTKDRVVGYGAYHFYADNEPEGLYSFEQKQALLYVAKQSILQGLKSHQPLSIDVKQLPFPAELCRDSFVTLEKQGQLRGCIGSIQAHRQIALDVCENAFKAAFHDPRFPPVTESEVNDIALSISLLSPFVPIQFSSEADLLQKIRPGIEGIVIQDQQKSALFLPHVWSQLPDREQFLQALKKKAGFATTYWSNTITVHGFTADVIA